jgi:hypothetical protein
MTVAINIERGGAEISWEPGEYVGPVRIKAVNIENGDVGVVKDVNDGHAFLTWPPGTYSDHVTVYEDSGDPQINPLEANVIDEGTITVTVT